MFPPPRVGACGADVSFLWENGIMKKLLLLTALTVVTASSTGCQCGPVRLWWRCITGADRQPAAICAPDCGPCGTGPTFGEPYLGGSGTMVVPGPIAQ